MNSSRKKVIIFLSVLVPIVVAMLFGVRIKTDIDFGFLPKIYASINFITFILLVVALVLILKGKEIWHERIIKLCVALTSLFLVLYITYHSTTDSTHFGGEGLIKYVYFFILISHILLSVGVIPLVLFSLGWAMDKDFAKHKRIARIALPIWMYVAITGVIVYLLISPYYT
jgi:putative membrane protein